MFRFFLLPSVLTGVLCTLIAVRIAESQTGNFAQQHDQRHDLGSPATVEPLVSAESPRAEVYRIQCRNIAELEASLRQRFGADPAFSLTVRHDAEPGIYRVAVLASEAVQRQIVPQLQQQAVLLPKQPDISTVRLDAPPRSRFDTRTNPASPNSLPATPAPPITQPITPPIAPPITHAAAPFSHGPAQTLQTGFVTPGIAGANPPMNPIHSAFDPVTAPSPRSVGSSGMPPAVAPHPNLVASEQARDSFAPEHVSVSRIEQMLRSLLASRFNELSAGKYLLAVNDKRGATRDTMRSGAKRHCTVDIDRENGRVLMNGDKTLCDQLVQLIDAIDQPAPSDNRERRFLSTAGIRNETIARILEINSTPRGPSQTTSPTMSTITSPSRIPSQATPQFRHPEVPITTDPPPRIEFRNSTGQPAVQPLPNLPVDLFPKSETSGGSKHLDPRRNPVIQLVGYQFQGDGAGDFGGGMEGGGVEAMERQGGPMNPVAPGMEVVSDFRYRILPDLDVLIIDATGAEVARFKDMIDQIQELSKIADPKIEVYYLKNVNCVSLGWVIRQVYQDAGYFRTKQGMITIVPMINPNAMLLIGWGQAFESMKDLLETLDKPVAAEDGMMHVIRLKHAAANYVLPILRSAFPRPPMANSGLAARIEMYADARTNSIIVQAGPNDLKEIQRIIDKIDVPDAGLKLRIHQFKLKHTMAADMAQVLTTAITPGTTGTSDKKLPALEMLVEDENGSRMIESGIMSDVRVSSNPHTNTLIVTAPEKALPLIERLIDMLDVPSSMAEVKIFEILNGDAESLVETLRSLIPTQLEGQTGPQLPGSAEDESIIPVRFAVDKRTNSILAAGSPGDLLIIEALLKSVDREDQQRRKQTVYMLKSMMAKDVAVAINAYLKDKRAIREAAPGVISPFQQIESEVIIVPENVNNALIISATPRYFDEIMEMIREIDQSPPQVVIQVLIGEVTLGSAKEFGAEFGIQDSLLFNRSTFDVVEEATRKITKTDTSGNTVVIEEPFILNGSANPGWLFNESTTSSLGDGYNSNSASTVGTVGSQLLTNFATGRVGAETGFGGMVFSANSDAVSIMIRALQETSRLEVLSRPQIMAMNNQEALVHVGQNVPRIKGTTTTSYQEKMEVEDEEVGLMLLVQPSISPEGNIVMRVQAQKSKISSDSVVVGYSDGQPVRSPAIDIINTRTMVSAADNETVVIGGLISKETQKLHRKVPLLGDIPLLGKLFSYEYDKCRRSELLIILTPRIVRDSHGMEEIKQIETARMNWCLAGVSELHGDIGTYTTVAEQPYIGDAVIVRPGMVDIDSLTPLEDYDIPNAATAPAFPPQVQPQQTRPQLAPPQNGRDQSNESDATKTSGKLPVPTLPKGLKK